ncbi:TIM barrel protein [Paraburkholderia sp. NMBU_R16]|uniref:sugar phosphate isomerase/epimerase family protein n=1 Tax=Paraburkholderia sp. NMBU_R16 TaxID=2698676 RepID=UPI0015651E01|nr:sugar phosphate isomerase/epimerase [Paraburkholderia sp. NMBU_R16]NRO99449.1 TIM barrel protein [Paraburkholderia sp. NMBU_R16]
MKRCMATVGLGGRLPQKLEAIAAAGFDSVELVDVDLAAFDGNAKTVRRIASELGLDIATFQPLRDFEGGPRAQVKASLDRADALFDVTQTLGASLLLMCSNVSGDTVADDDVVVDDLRMLAKRALDRGLRLGYEALSWGRYVSSYQDAWRIVQRVGAANFGLVLDSFHAFCRADDLSPIATIPVDRIFFVQLADAPKLDLDFLSWSRRFRCHPGQGDFDLTRFLMPLMENGYDGPVSLEIFNEAYRLLPPGEVASKGFDSLRQLLDNVAATS